MQDLTVLMLMYNSVINLHWCGVINRIIILFRDEKKKIKNDKDHYIYSEHSSNYKEMTPTIETKRNDGPCLWRSFSSLPATPCGTQTNSQVFWLSNPRVMFRTFFITQSLFPNERDRRYAGYCVLQLQGLFSSLSAASHMWRVVQRVDMAVARDVVVNKKQVNVFIIR